MSDKAFVDKMKSHIELAIAELGTEYEKRLEAVDSTGIYCLYRALKRLKDAASELERWYDHREFHQKLIE